MTGDLFDPPQDFPGDRRPVLVAMNNPLSSDPRHVLYPHPVNCTGWRLWRMIDDAANRDVSKAEYLAGLDRRNLLSGRVWSAAEARGAAGGLLDALRGRTVAVVGVATLKAMRLPRPAWCEWREERGVRYTLIPHASGLCHEYNDPVMRARVGALLLELLDASRAEAARV